MMSRRLVMILAVVLGFYSFACPSIQAKQPFLHPLFSDNMVLQREIKTPVWGWTTPGSEVTVELDGKTATCKAGADGKWMAELPPHKAGGPFVMKVTGPEAVSLQNVLLGDVWLCSGQSNMEMGIRMCDKGDEEVASAKYPEIRLFTVPKRTSLEPESFVKPGSSMQSKWLVCSPETAGAEGWGGFSAVGYFFGREIHKTAKVPIGLIHSSWGGTICEAWASAEGLKTVSDFKDTMATFEAQVARMKVSGSNLEKDMEDWWANNDPGTKAGWSKSDLDISDWKLMEGLPQIWEKSGLPNFDGVVWFRKMVDVPVAWASIDATLNLAMIDDIDTAFVNGIAVGGTDNWQTHRGYKLPKGLLKAGRNVIAVRVLDTGGDGGFHGSAAAMNLAAPGQTSIPLAGSWQYKVATQLTHTKPFPRRLNDNPNQTTVLYNGMIAPLLPYAIKGAIWYQGEHNSPHAVQYRTLFPAMIEQWRADFNNPTMPFLFVQLPGYANADANNRPIWPEQRESQLLTWQNLKNTGMAVTIDLGDKTNIHPTHKEPVGNRLAAIALNTVYGMNIPYSGPVYKSVKFSKNQAIIAFNFVYE
ncbi:MAG: sialate O-acetylesterase, partial [bacterium]